ncbi:UDP-4-amino-4,6-dideoxy-N-acetyl-beta-L-altrosamine transaminase [Paenibacillus sepulcri]|uniref:UDP-4-amino-4, 6-dideoxy-N-acetyl-beta-L-altrosamine transaminase n=1 Tax=Paenibacillus sepulcri TaxID=359917 RepID=UPI0035E9E9D0
MDKLAITGGKPVRKKLLKYGGQWIEKDDIRAVMNILKSDFLTTGPSVAEFEQMLAEYVGAPYAVAFSSGTAALHAACCMAGIGPGDEVITTSLTFAASANCILYCGASPVFADIDENTYNIDPASIESKITNKTKAILPVHFAGQPVDLSAIMDIAARHGLIVIEDAAHALGAEYGSQKIGSGGNMACFSFHPVKHITTGEGGAVTTHDAALYEKLVQFRSHGIIRDPGSLTLQSGAWYHEMQFLGYNYRLTDFQAALGISQFRKVDRFLGLRREYAALYTEAFKDMRELSLPSQSPASLSSWHLYTIRLNTRCLNADRREIYDALWKENIGVNVHYLPVYLHPYYKQLGYETGLCPKAEQLYEELLTLPLFPRMSRKDVNDVITALKKVLHYYSKL